ncbi:hypothetical protein [Leptolyngbya sp. KIOST-1]|uniref:hypothetical protein n=1 Tax=Leptolyngbya sp. KIOST-1 TaxID=1229172 RepID=UPI0005614F88|nr:hypothetical protein [Leptolyngbya sp. KIOST-1]
MVEGVSIPPRPGYTLPVFACAGAIAALRHLLNPGDRPHSSIGQRAGDTSDPAFLRNWDFRSASADVAESAGKMLYADYVESGTYPVIMANKFGGVIFHEACGHLLGIPREAREPSAIW